jgi:hypothetical protein
MPTNQGQIVVLLIMVAIGFVFGALIVWWVMSRSKPEEELTPEQEQEAQFRQLFEEQVSLWRKRGSGKLAMRSGSKVFENTQRLTPAQLDSVHALALEWLEWLGYKAPLTAGVPPVDVPVPPAVIPVSPPASTASTAVIPLPPVISTSPSTSQVVSTPPVISPPVERQPASYPVSSKSLPPVPRPAAIPVVTQPNISKKDKAAEKPKSIVEQIDEILQEKLADTPHADKEIRLVEDPARGAIVWVGLDHYNGVEAVPDPAIKAILREAAAEWERRMTPGKKK